MRVKRGKVLSFEYLDTAVAAWLVRGAVWVLSVGGLVVIG